MSDVTGATVLAGIIGDPVRHSRSPAIHNAAYTALELNWVFVAFPVAAGEAAVALRGLVASGVAGVSVTMPHKTDAARACDVLSPTAETLDAVNTVVVRDGALHGSSTDGEGFLRSVATEGADVAGRRVLVLGAGGAARAIVLTLGTAGAQVMVAARRREAAEQAARLAPGASAESLDAPALDALVESADIVVNATPLGMAGEPPPFATELLRPTQIVVDAVYHPAETPLLAAARARGARGIGGLGMLVHQAALAFELMTGRAAPLDAMWAGARAR